MLICFRRPVECIKFALFVVVVIVVLSLNFACMRKELVSAHVATCMQVERRSLAINLQEKHGGVVNFLSVSSASADWG